MPHPARSRLLACATVALGIVVSAGSAPGPRTAAPAAPRAVAAVGMHANRDGVLLTAGSAGTAKTPIQHVIFLMKENRSYDNYFGSAVGVSSNPLPGANGATTAYDRFLGRTVTLAQTPEPMPNDIGHGPPDFKESCDAPSGGTCRMDGFSRENGSNCTSSSTCKLASSCNCYLSLTQMAPSGYTGGATPCSAGGSSTFKAFGPIPNYWCYAETYGLADNAFSDFIGGSFINNVMTVAGQAGGDYAQAMCPPHATPGHPDAYFGACAPAAHMSGYGNPVPAGTCSTSQPGNPGAAACWGCDDPAKTWAPLQNTTGPEVQGAKMFPCYPFLSLPDELSSAGVPWRYYADPKNKDFQHVAIDGIQSVRYSAEWNQLRPLTQFSTDVESGTSCGASALPSSPCLPAVSWVEGDRTDHPVTTACAGEGEMTTLMNLLMRSPLWSSTAVFVTWDEWGGFYDHVAPPHVSGFTDNISFGFRIPLLALSPWVQQGSNRNRGYVSHQFYSETSELKFVEANWGLSALTNRDATSSPIGDLMDFFDFSQTAAQQRPALSLPLHTCSRLTAAEQQIWSTEADD